MLMIVQIYGNANHLLNKTKNHPSSWRGWLIFKFLYQELFFCVLINSRQMFLLLGLRRAAMAICIT
jgi:hypothetical protein